ncbi:MAG: response regulator [Proteobacteria bacterium]|nr:response regulator [Pseudomonadota bacterium]
MMASILVVDDEKSIRITLGVFLREAGYEVSVAQDVDQAIAMLMAKDFDVVLTDVVLPRISGVHLLKTIKETSPHVQVILMTGEPTVETASEAARASAFDYLAKPVSKEQLLKTVANAAKSIPRK